MAKVQIYSKTFCPYCVRAKNLLAGKNVPFEEIMIDDKPADYEALKKRTGHMTVPQIFINDRFVGGFNELSALNSSGELDRMLAL